MSQHQTLKSQSDRKKMLLIQEEEPRTTTWNADVMQIIKNSKRERCQHGGGMERRNEEENQ